MWQELVQQVGIFWIILVFLVTAGLIALTVVFFLSLQRLAVSSRNRLNKLNQGVDGLESCRIENLALVEEQVEQIMNDSFKTCFARLKEDSQVMFSSKWVPDPASRLALSDILSEPVRAVFRKSMGSAVILGGIAATTLALSSGFVLTGSLADAAFLRLMAIMPLVVSAIGMLILHQASDLYYRQVKQSWHRLMITMERKLPVYTQAAETAIMLNRMRDYDDRMSKATLIMAEQVQNLASNRLTEAVASAVKYVMSATVAPAVIKSTEALAMLTQQIEKRMQETENQVSRLYLELESRQKKQSDLWVKRYQEITEILTDQQAEFLKNISASEQQLTDSLTKAQTLTLEKLVEEQRHTLEHINGVSQKSWSILQEKLTSIITQLADGQQKLLTGLNEQQQTTISQVSTASLQTTEAVREQFAAILKNLDDFQTQAYEQLISGQKESLSTINEQQQIAYQKAVQLQKDGLQQMQSQQETTLQRVSETQTTALQQMSTIQNTALGRMSETQSQFLQEIDGRQSEAVKEISTQQAASLQIISEQQSAALRLIGNAQSMTLDAYSKKQEASLTEMTENVQRAMQMLSDRFAGQVSGTLATYLDPVTTRLQESSEALIAAQSYARDVKDVLKLQNESATTLQVSIKDLFGQLVETRQTMSEDLVSLKASSGIMSKAAESMSNVYAGSQAGLSEAISQMSHDLMRLSDVLSAVMAGSAEQTRMMQTQSQETYEINQKHLDAVRSQITLLSDELSTRIDQLMLGFSNLTEDLVKNIDNTINTQNDTLGSSLRSLTDIMSEEARSMSLFAQEINMDIDTLNENLRSAVSEFDSGMRNELSSVLSQFDTEVADIVKRLARSAVELGDAVEALPEAIRHAAQSSKPGSTAAAS